MKRTLATLLLAAMLAGCTTSTSYGPCVGLGGYQDPKLVYKLSVWNVVLAVVFVETIFVPVIVIVDNTFCPEGKR